MTPANEFPGNIIFYAFFIGAIAFFAYSAGVRFRWFTKAKWVNRFDAIPQRIAGMFPYLLGNSRVARKRYWYSGLLHTMIWWGFIVLQIRTLNFLLSGISNDLTFSEIIGDPYEYIMWPMMDLFNVLVLIGVAMAAYQRFFVRPPRMTLNMDAWIILGFLFVLMVSDILVNSLEIYIHQPENAAYAFLANAVAEFWESIELSADATETLFNISWYLHLCTFLGFLCYLPYSKHSHVLTVVPQVFTRRLEPTGVLAPIPNIEQAESFGVGKLQDFTWRQLLDSYSCTECGRCTNACPANITGKLLSPKHVIHDIRLLMEEQEPAVLPSTKKPETPTDLIEGVGFEQIWDCVTCGACMEECPVFIEHVPTIMDMRRYLVMEKSEMPETAVQTLMQIEQRGHPWRGTQMTRTQWIEEMAAEGTEVPIFDGSQEYLYWVGCTGALQERNVKVTKSLVRLLIQANVSFGVLAMEEGCSGDPARRLGNEYLYQIQAQQNIEVMKAKGVQKVLANCPHCYNTIAHEYPQFDGKFETIHHTVFLAQLVEQGKLRPDQVNLNGLQDKTATYHDPCYVSRHNNIIDEPRAVLAATGIKSEEMGRCKRGTFCCGAGGSHMWVEESRGERINVVRSQEAFDTGADLIAVACPFCMQMFESGIGSVPGADADGKNIQVFDLAELLEMSVAISKPVVAGNGTGGAASAAEPSEGDQAQA